MDELLGLEKTLRQRERALEIEAALERVRSRSMAMQSTEELSDVLSLLFQQFDNLGIQPLTVWLTLWNPEDNTFTYRSTGISGKRIQGQQVVDIEGMDIWKALYDKWKSGSSEAVEVLFYPKEDLKQLFTLMADTFESMPKAERLTAAHFPKGGYSVQGHCKFGYIGYTHTTEPTQKEKDILSRFAKEFARVYQRFLDIKKAEAMAREAQIEAALERVRSCIMAMGSPEDLKQVAAEVRRQIELLGQVDLEVSVVHLYEKDSPYFHSIAAIPEPDGEIICMESFFPVNAAVETLKMMENYWAGKQEYSIKLSRKKAREWQQIVLKNNPDLGVRREEIISNLPLPDQPEYWNFSDFSGGSFLIVTHAPPTPEALNLLRRSAKIFDLAYRRYLDLKKAEAQAREAQIETALERVRSQSMSMQKSDELKDVIRVIFNQLALLKINAEHAGIVIDYEAGKDWTFWVAETAETQDIPSKVTIPFLDSLWDRQFAEAKEKGTDFFSTHLTFDEKNTFYKKLLLHIPNLTKKAKDFYFSCPGLAIATTVQQDIGLYIENFSGTPYSTEENDILLRFGKVFQQTYTRFLDIKKAEAQTREAQIETALERVRAASMAMHNSSELYSVINILSGQLGQLGIEMDAAMINEKVKDSKDWYMWLAIPSVSKEAYSRREQVHVPYIRSAAFDRIYGAEKEGKSVYSDQLTKPQKDLIFNHYFKNSNHRDVPKARQDYIFSGPGLSRTTILSKNSFIQFYRYNNQAFKEEENLILERIGKVFEQSYTRFLDLQKAEEQAREAQIEAALERVRASTMAMHKSQDLPGTALVLYEQLALLGDIPDRMCIGIFTEETGEITLWGTDQSGSPLNQKFTSYWKKSPVMTKFYKAWKAGREFQVEDLKGQTLKTWLKFIREDMGLFVDGTNIKGRRVQQAAFFSDGFLLATTNETVTTDIAQLLIRFAKVFSQTYTRFLDLQKAEAQAREAQIEAALERVRARTMAMHKSEELSEVASVLFEQIENLGATPERLNIGIIREQEGVIEFWSTKQGGQQIDKLFKGSIEEPTTLAKMYSAWKAGKKSLAIEQTGEELKRWIHHLEKVIGLPFDKSLKRDRRVHSAVFFTHGMLLVSTPETLPKESINLLSRFSKVFEQTYTRFLDLQKAEAQARESQIDAALERVRARTMAMHSSENISSTVATFFNEMTGLGLEDNFVCGINILSQSELGELWAATEGHTSEESLYTGFLDMSTHPLLQNALDSWERGESSSSHSLEGEEVQEYHKVLNDAPDFPVQLNTKEAPKTENHWYANFPDGYIFCISEFPIPEEIQNILKRFASVFGQTYTRFLDLQKAEAQAREAHIEAGLERVRAKTMAMHNSQDVAETVIAMFDEILNLGLDHTMRCGIGIPKDKKLWDIWSVNAEQGHEVTLRVGIINMTIHPITIASNKAFQSGKDFSHEFTKEEVISYYTALNNQPEYKFDADLNLLPDRQFMNSFNFKDGALFTFTENPLTEEGRRILERFNSVFGQTYRRFLDLLRAEGQAREAQIEAALERVRSRTMAMHNSEDVGHTVITLFQEVTKLGLDNTIRCGIGILEGYEGMETWSANSDKKGDINLKMGMLNMTIHPALIGLKKAWKKGENGYSYHFIGEDVTKYYTALNNEPEYPFEIDLTTLPDNHFANIFCFAEGILFAFTHNPLSEEAKKVLDRFANVFGQTYRRYLDLLRAEEQVRESQIEAALERVRAKTMAMHNTDDIADTVITFFEELVGLGLDDTMRAGIGILSQSEQMKVWTASVPGTSKTTLHAGLLEMSLHPLLQGVKRAWMKGDTHFNYTLKGKDLIDYFHQLNQAPDYPAKFDLKKLPETVNHQSIPFEDGILFAFTESPLPEDIIQTLERFAAVFGQTYTRYLDLERAEKQARESRIEASLERVRAKALAMHSSEDLRQTITAVFQELKNLDVRPLRMGLGLINPDKREGEIVASQIDDNDQIVEVSGKIKFEGHPVLDRIYDHFKKGLDYFDVLQGAEINSYYAALGQSIGLHGYGTDTRHYGCFLPFKEGGIYAWAAQPHTDEQIGILKKFSRVVEITYRRYNDLIESEAREKEAVKQASLDRVRAEIASMRTTKDLERITPLVWKELTTLGIPFFRCGVFIMNEASQMVHVYLTTPEGDALAVMDLPFDFEVSFILKGVEHWRKQKAFIEEWDQKQFIELTTKLMEHGQVQNIQTYQAGEKPPKRLVLHQVPFAQGMLYVGSTQTLSEVEMDIVKALTRTFAVAYARYEDFNQLEKTLAELKATQDQLIQSEKMASLGELTAGIAHEIKNPLNFVNNFSEVSRELIQELLEELKKGDIEEVNALAADVMQNLEKIVHHGQRADGIVKGMLQHSRSSDGNKEPTDLNELADEYLRLAYHGLRAKDKTFNARMETDFDKTLGNIEVIPQDIGRVLLNLLTNAFHAVSEGKAAAPEGYEPTVWVETKKTANAVKVTVRDNGDGIPDKIRDKIFQPFFTTKPTGSGTGLGLSLSYDIIKAHGGELTMESEEGKGTEFIINLPVL